MDAMSLLTPLTFSSVYFLY